MVDYLIRIICFSALTFSFANLGMAQSTILPKVGDRVYLIEKNSAAPVAIKKDFPQVQNDQVVLRDPTLKMTDRPKPARVKKAPVVVRAKAPVKKSGQLSFKPAKINGNMKNPRVEFRQEYLRVGISEESYGSDFFQKVNEPLTDSSF